MTEETTDLATRLRELAESPAPPMALDLDAAKRAGRRRRRFRVSAAAGGCAAVIVAASVVLPPLLDGPSPAPQASSPSDPARPPVPTAKTAAGANPMIAKAGFGWLPEVIRGVEYGVGAHGDYTLAIGDGQYPAMIWLAVYDKEPPADRLGEMGGEAVKVPTKVGDRDGYWVTVNPADPLNGGDSYLRWRTGDGRWAELNAYYLDIPDVRQTLLRVAEGVTVGDYPVPLPLRISGLPGGFHLADGLLSRRPSQDGVPWTMQLFYTVNGANVVIDVRPEGGGAPDGRGEPVCTTENSLRACVRIDRPNAADLGSIGGAQGLLDRITLLGPDERDWTTTVIG
ncbi:hypothetical protein [Prauserella muralis]|uniref:Uncharacterized protein n=1 Tax=Prauserella muralis TaxID=588067 RepID=A0A2V4AZL2_9PSEU|nr:hypothetical protein [Prauserella muralis]PXY27183.1 hypothetical protein BAY60_12000 [Prauserella muralis]TWE23165.1 hypothetical protein FHX69_4425 [Prauserella muralis]